MSFIDQFANIDIQELRKEAEKQLQWCYAHGHITIDVLESRLEELHKTEDKKAVLALVEDLPAPSPEEDYAGSNDGQSGWYHSGTGKKKEDYFSLLGSNSRQGSWDVPEKIDVSAILGAQELDFSNARFPRKPVRIQAFTFMGSIEMKFPHGVNVSSKGVPILASIDNRVESDGNGPQVEIEGFAVMGSIDARSSKKK